MTFDSSSFHKLLCVIRGDIKPILSLKTPAELKFLRIWFGEHNQSVFCYLRLHCNLLKNYTRCLHILMIIYPCNITHQWLQRNCINAYLAESSQGLECNDLSDMFVCMQS